MKYYKITVTVAQTLSATEAVTNVVASDIGDNGDGSDLRITFNKAADETKVGSYRVIVLKSTANIDLAGATALVTPRYTTVAKTGSNLTVILGTTSVDSDGDVIVNGSYKIYVLSVADGTKAMVNALSAPCAVTSAMAGINWTSRSSGTANHLHGITWGGSQFVTVGSSGTILTSSEGSIWTAQSSPVGGNIQNVAWNGSNYVAVNLTNWAQTSSNGVLWGYNNIWSGPYVNVTWAGGLFIALGYSLDLVSMDVFSSPNGATGNWSGRNPTGSSTHTMCDVAWNGTNYILVGSGGFIVNSPSNLFDGTRCVSGTTQNLYGIIWNGTKFVVVGAGGTILTSMDGSTWVPQNSGTTSVLNRIIWNGTIFVAVGAGGTILTSPDGVNWTPQNSGTIQDLYGITWNGSKFVVVGNNGTILTSQ
jgi:hypothetical protein